MAAVDANAAALGVPTKQLMESSGNAVAEAVRELADPGAAVAVVAGRGNNGGDAFVAARFLDGYDVSVRLLGRPESVSTDAARENWEALEASEYDAEAVTDSKNLELGDLDVVVDGVFGTGFEGAPREPEATAVEAMNDLDAPVVAVDVPSGLNADTGETEGVAVDADRVVTFHDTKPGLSDLGAEVTVADIGIPSAAERFVGPGDLRRLRDRLRGHKGEDDTGRVFVVGGGPYTGAPALAAQAALRAGADLSFVACPESVATPIRGYAEDLIVQPYEGSHLTPDRVDSLVETATTYDDVVVLGPGLGSDDETREAVERFLGAFDGKAVVDADAIPAVPDVDTDADLVLTPNTTEAAELGGPEVDDVREGADEFESLAADLGQTLAVKGKETLVTDGEETRIAREAAQGMTVGGTGDVLSGVVAAFLGVAAPFDAACAAAYAKGRAGERLDDERGAGFVASDVLDEIPAAVWERDGE